MLECFLEEFPLLKISRFGIQRYQLFDQVLAFQEAEDTLTGVCCTQGIGYLRGIGKSEI